MTERIDEKDLPLVSAAPTDELRAVRGGKSVRVPIVSLPASAAVQAQLDALAAGQAAGQKVYRTWSELSAITGSAGTGAQVIDDTGTHTDPVVGGTVANAGQYVWSESPAGWRWVRPDALVLKADKSQLKAANILPDPFNEHISRIGWKFGGRTWFDARPDFASSPNLASAFPVLSHATEVRRYWSRDDVPAQVGDTLHVRVRCWIGGSSGTFALRFVDAAGTGLGASPAVTLTGSGEHDVTLPITVESGWSRLRIIVNSAGGVEVAQYAAAVGERPEFTVPRMSARLELAAAPTPPISTDPFLRAMDAPIGATSRYYGTWNAAAVNSPFGGGSISGTNEVIRRFDLAALGLKVGDTFSARIVIHKTTDDVSWQLQFRNAGGGSISNVSSSVGPGSGLFDSTQYATVPAGAVSVDMRSISAGLNATEIVATAICRGYGWPALAEASPSLDYLRSQFTPAPPTEIAEPAIYGIEFLTRTRRKVGSLISPATGDSADNAIFNIGLFGDSWVADGARWPRNLAVYLAALLGDGGPGWYGFLYDGDLNNFPLGNARGPYGYTYSRTGTWTDVDETSPSPDLGHCYSSTPGDYVVVGGPSSQVVGGATLYSVGTGSAASVRYRWNAGTWYTVDITSPDGKVLLSELGNFPSSGAWTLTIEVVSGTCRLCGVNIRNTNVRGARVHKVANLGSQASDWATVGGEWEVSVAGLNLDTALFLVGTNDQGQGRTPAAMVADIEAWVGRVRAAFPACDVILVSPCENLRTNATPMSEFTAAVRSYARSARVTHVDLQPHFGPDPAGYADLFIDNTHPSNEGGRVTLEAIRRLLVS